MQVSLFLWVFVGHSITVGLAELIFTSLIRISAKSKHYATVAMLRVVPVRRAKAFIWRKVVPLARVTLPAKATQLAHPSCFAPRDGFAILMWTAGWILERNRQNVTSARVAWEESCLGYRHHINEASRETVHLSHRSVCVSTFKMLDFVHCLV